MLLYWIASSMALLATNWEVYNLLMPKAVLSPWDDACLFAITWFFISHISQQAKKHENINKYFWEKVWLILSIATALQWQPLTGRGCCRLFSANSFRVPANGSLIQSTSQVNNTSLPGVGSAPFNSCQRFNKTSVLAGRWNSISHEAVNRGQNTPFLRIVYQDFFQTCFHNRIRHAAPLKSGYKNRNLKIGIIWDLQYADGASTNISTPSPACRLPPLPESSGCQRSGHHPMWLVQEGIQVTLPHVLGKSITFLRIWQTTACGWVCLSGIFIVPKILWVSHNWSWHK